MTQENTVLVDIDAPYKDTVTVSLDYAIRAYDLSDTEIEKIKADGVVWVDDIAISKTEEETEP